MCEIVKMMMQSLHLQDRRNFVRAPPAGVNYEFDYDKMYPVAVAIMAEDPNLEKMRFDLVPKVYVQT